MGTIQSAMSAPLRWLLRGHANGSRSSNRDVTRRYAFAFLCLLIAFLARHALNPVLDAELPYAFFSPAAMLAAWYGRVVPGFLVLVIGLFCGHFFFIPPQGEWKPLELFEELRLISAAVPAFISIWIIELLHRARHRADHAALLEKQHAARLRIEIHERQRAERELRFSEEITRAISEVDSFRAALGISLHKICDFTGWALGHAWVPSINQTKAELCPEICTCHPRLANFKDITERTTFAPGVGLVGRVWQSKQPLWIRDLRTAPEFLRGAAAQEAGIKTALFFPILAAGEVVAILEFFHEDARDKDEAFVRLISAVAAQLGALMQRKRAEQRLKDSERQLNEAQTIARIGNWEWDVQTNELQWSDELHELFEVPKKEFRHTYNDFIIHVHPEDRAFVESHIQTVLQDGKPFEFEHRIAGPDGSVRYMHCNVAAARSSTGTIAKLFGTAQDITQQKQTQMALDTARLQLQEYASSLEKKVAARTADLEKSLQETEGLLYTIAHDLRAPLRAMSGLTHILLEEYAPHLGENGQNYARRVVEASKKMDRLINDLLTYGRLTHTDFPKTEINLDELLKRVIAQFQSEIQARQAEIEIVHPLPVVWSNAAVLEQILANLISNALKFVAKKTKPRIRILAETRDSGFRIVVQDNGIGIPKEFQEKIFKVFEKLHSPAEYEGTGVGLAVVRKGIERLGGKVGVDSEVGKGSRFWFEVPGN